MSLFSRVIMTDQPEIAKVNTQTGVLFLNSKIWDTLPRDQKNFVLFHEEGHLRLQTNDEFAANEYAVNKFAPAGKFTNKELGQRILVMRDILRKATPANTPGFTGLISETSEGIGSIIQNLSILGIGSKGRTAEYSAAAEAEATKAKATQKIILVAGVLILVTVITFLILKK